ncbi:unnamed protein product [Allacma fusca]|uniref:Uncharacterized protein n=1 Tax=Allacma fusca TaxID=39272 RepID=A0A8J2K725_9HEXA|nr:unnamed protein product [Allacma fusca]
MEGQTTLPNTFRTNHTNDQTFIRIDNDLPGHNYQSNLKLNLPYSTELYSSLDSSCQQKPRSYSESSANTDTSIVGLLGNEENTGNKRSDSEYDVSFAVTVLHRYRNICIYIRHIILAAVLVLMAISFGIFLYDIVTAEEAALDYQEETIGQDKASLQEIPTKRGTFSLMSFAAPQPPLMIENTPTLKKREISSAKDLKALDKCERLVIENLVEDRPSPGILDTILDEKDKKSVQVLEVKGAVTEEWLEFILNNFMEVSDLSLDVFGLCVGSKVPNRNSLQALKLQKVQTLTIDKAYLCPLMNWVMQWSMPNIKTIIINEADLSKLQFEPLVKFIDLNQNSLSSVQISKSTICSECFFPSELQSKIKIDIVDPVESPSDSYEEYDI